MTDHNNDDPLADIDLLAWRVPAPRAIDAPSLVTSAFARAASPPRRPRLGWLVAAIVVVNAVIATLIVILLARAPAPQQSVAVTPAGGGGSMDASVRDLLTRLDQQQRDLERELADIRDLRALVVELSDKVRALEQEDARRDHTVPKVPDHHAVIPPPGPTTPAIPPSPTNPPTPADGCDEVSCVLTDNNGACCAKYKKNAIQVPPPPPTMADGLDRSMISNGVASVKASVNACGTRSTVHGTVKLHVRVNPDGTVTNVVVNSTPDAALGGCVAAAVQRAVFARTGSGGSFSYPFVF